MSLFAGAAGASYWHACPKGQVVGRHRLFCYAESVGSRACETLSLTLEWGNSDLEARTTAARSVVYRRRAVHLRTTIEPRGAQFGPDTFDFRQRASGNNAQAQQRGECFEGRALPTGARQGSSPGGSLNVPRHV